MTYSRFQNLRELFQGDLAKKLREGAHTIKGLHGPNLQLQHCIQKSRQLLPLPVELPEVNHCLQNNLQLLQHGLHWLHSTTLQTEDEPTLPRGKTASVEGIEIVFMHEPLRQAL